MSQQPGRPPAPRPGTAVSRRLLLQMAGVAGVAAAAGPHLGPLPRALAAELALARAEIGTRARPFELGQVRLTTSRWTQNQDRTLAYLRSVDVNRLLYNFRANHRLSTQGAQALGGWEAPNFPFRSHSQGHFLTAWAQAWAVLGDTTCRDKATTMVAELAKCQANNGAAGFTTGYLSGFPESDFNAVETGSGNVSYYAIHKTLAGLLDVWRLLGSTQARDVLLRFAGWVDARTGRLSQSQMQVALRVEFGGMNAVFADLYLMTDDRRWLTVAQRFDHASVFDPLAANRDQLNGSHANTQVPKWVGAAREYKSTGTTRYRDIAGNAWAITVGAHTYAIGGNSEAEHFRPPNAISTYLDHDTAEQCNTYNMLKLTRELWTLDPDDARYFDYYERALLNHLLGAQNPSDPMGGFSYFTPLRPGGRRGTPTSGPAWGGGTFSTPYTTFWCCQGTGIETNTKLMDSIYFSEGTTLTVNLFMPSTLTWTARNVTVTQATTYPVGDTTTLTIGGSPSGSWTVRVRIPAWATGASLTLNGAALDVAAAPGSYASVTRTWAAGDALSVRLPMTVRVEPTNDDPGVGAVFFGPTVLSGNYGDRALSGPPALDVASVTRAGAGSLAFTARADGQAVNLGPFYDAHGHNYTVYWRTDGQGGGTPTGTSGPYRLVNVASGLVLGIAGMATTDGGLALQWGDNGSADHDWVLVPDGDSLKLRNVHSGKVLGVENMSTADGARVLQWGDTGTADHRWGLVDAGDGTHRVRNVHTSRVLGMQGNGTAQGAQAVMSGDDGSTDNRWRVVPTGARRIQNRNSGLMLGVTDMSSADGARVLQWADTGTADHLWTATLGSDGLLRVRNQHTGKLLAVDGTGNGGRAISTTDTGATTQRWRLRYGSGGYFRLQSATGRVLGVDAMSTTQGAQVLVWDDSGTADHLWRFV
ncbi:beta-L-arabinofuranosidase domain-containing protein [Cellulomonas sp. S1-8]|uniref:beta-L-arabinofuranosidase domain-containing protein n=1 Tax=Cellulomonas sp. S1-8 TaxID=2904790 RepID=UPI0022431ADB|nr:beta-L-arabinofuranosidase domain-containing protein [Cellulomonas sp. S1-8]UZN02830.1 glycoside hydrolase family 127 protein [Cellulomonas sp. S1-8]